MVVSRNGYLTLPEMQENARAIYGFLLTRGWTRAAIAGMLGNMQTESTINPGIWQSLTINPALGYGLVQWTPSTKVTSWLTSNGFAIDDIYGQLSRIDWEQVNEVQWIPTATYNFSFREFRQSDESPEYLAQAFLRNYERPANQNQPIRSTQARYWFDYLTEIEEVCIHPFDYINISQGENGSYSHEGTLCIDYVGPTTLYPYYAPCKVRLIHQQDNGAVRVWVTEDEVLCADGVIRKFFFSTIHDEINFIPQNEVGSYIANQGELIGHTGIAGNATGDHAHIQVIDGDNYQGFFTNSYGSISLVGDELHQYRVFFLTLETDVVNGYGYDWRYYDGKPPKPPKPSPKRGLIHLWLGGALKL